VKTRSVKVECDVESSPWVPAVFRLSSRAIEFLRTVGGSQREDALLVLMG
jgi:hypothetical protein